MRLLLLLLFPLGSVFSAVRVSGLISVVFVFFGPLPRRFKFRKAHRWNRLYLARRLVLLSKAKTTRENQQTEISSKVAQKGCTHKLLTPLTFFLSTFPVFLSCPNLSPEQPGEDLLQLLLSNVCALLDQLATLLGTSAGSPPPAAVAATLCAVLAVNSAAHVAVLHLLYSALLRAVGLRAPPMPAWVAKRVGVSSEDGSGVSGGLRNDPLGSR